MKVIRLTVDVLYDEANQDAVEVILDKMTTDWLIRDEIESFETSTGEPQEPDTDHWDYFYDYNEADDTWTKRE